jgi:glycosyltransferase involved in cell wall biosynthesis
MLKVLHLDIEGGWGGSSRSLYEIINCLDRTHVTSVVVHRSKGPIEDRYKELGIKTYHVPNFYSFVPRPQNSLKILIGTLPQLRYFFKTLNMIKSIARKEQVDFIHLNYEGLFFLGIFLKLQLKLPIIGHARTLVPNNLLGKLLAKTYSQICDKVFCISPNEHKIYEDLVGRGLSTKLETMYNVFNSPVSEKNSKPSNKAVFLGNIHPSKGVFKLLEVASELERMKSEVSIHVYGQDRSGKNFDLKFQEETKNRKLEHRVFYHGHTRTPEKELNDAMALVRLSDDHAPWGRDILEAVTLGVPTLCLGTFEGMIKHGQNGFLFERFDAMKIASSLDELSRNGQLWKTFHLNALKKGEVEFSGKKQSLQFERQLLPTP